MTGAAHVIRAGAEHLPLPDASVDLIVTSPPYYGLRAYTDGGAVYDGQIGSEPTPAEYIDTLVRCTAEWARVLKPEGSMFVNLGDRYDSGTTAARVNPGTVKDGKGQGWHQAAPRLSCGRPKSLMMLPERYRIACVDRLGLIARAVIVWCLSGGARVYARTPSGDRPIMLRDLARAYQPENVQLWNGQQWTQVHGWNRAPDDAGALEFELRTGERIGCTPGHRWPTQRGVIRADEVRVGDIIETTRLPQPNPPRTPALLPDEDIGWLVGLYIAEGSRSETTVQIAGHVNEHARHARLARIARALDGSCAVYQTGENTATCNLRGAVVAGVLDRYVTNGTAKTKRLRLAAWQRTDGFLAAVVDGYLSGGGHYDAKNDRWRLGFTANDEWAADLRTLAARLGAVLRLRRHSHQGFGQTYPGWRGEWRWTRSAHRNAKQDGEVIAVRKSRARDFYDVGVADEPHLFALASGVLTHNSKPNGLPESVTDRVRRSHEDWVHLVKSPRYYSAVDEIREPYDPGTAARYAAGYRSERARQLTAQQANKNTDYVVDGLTQNPLGKLPGSVWTIPTQPLNVPDHLGVDHFAAFPMEWPRRLIQGWSPPGICNACGQGRRPVTEKRGAGYTQNGNNPDPDRVLVKGFNTESLADPRRNIAAYRQVQRDVVATITGYACGCDQPTAPTRPAVVLDPFGGTGTTALAAKALGRTGITVDLSADYCRLAAWRTADPSQVAAAMGVKKPDPAPQVETLDLFGGAA